MKTDKTRVFNMDCMDYMRSVEDGYFELAVVDPEYGISVNHNMGRRKGERKSKHKPAYWDKESVSVDVLKEIFRISKNQIIWGANHFISKMPFDSPCWIMWDKGFSEEVTFAQFELAWTSFKSTCKKFDKNPNQKIKIHPTQKPVKLYEWILMNYAKEGDKILDTHLGSGSSRIAAYNLGFDFTGIELDEEYFNASVDRFNTHKSQLTLF